jgi:hypothetical protein
MSGPASLAEALASGTRISPTAARRLGNAIIREIAAAIRQVASTGLVRPLDSSLGARITARSAVKPEAGAKRTGGLSRRQQAGATAAGLLALPGETAIQAAT